MLARLPLYDLNETFLLTTLVAIVLCLFWPQLFAQLQGALELATMHWSQLGRSRAAATDSEIDSDELDALEDEVDDEEVEPVKRSLATGKAKEGGELYPGLYNAGGNACFLNAAVQSMASIESLMPYLIAVVKLARAQQQTAPVSTALCALVLELNKASTSHRVLKPYNLALALYNSSESRQNLMEGQQQDSHEFFVMLAEAIGDELEKLERGSREASEAVSFGLQTISTSGSSNAVSHVKDPFESLMARRVSCVSCQYTENVVHYHEEHLTLNVPFARTCTLYEMLDDYVKLDLIDERVCRKCSLVATVDRLTTELDLPPSHTGKRAHATIKRKRTQLATLKAALDAGEYEREELEGKLDRAERAATKQAMFSRPPQTLAVHLARSSAYRNGMAVKNSCRVAAPAELDLTPYTTSPALPTRPETSMGGKTKEGGAHRYRLTSVVEHFGSHSYGHYVAYTRRRGQWFRISDETVTFADLDDALYANPFLLFYDRIEQVESTSGAKEVKPRLVQRHVAGKVKCTSSDDATQS